MWFWSCVLLGAAAMDAQALLERAVNQIASAAGQQRRFACEASVVREFYAARRGKMELSERDRVRVEIAVFDGRQLFSWPGTASFVFHGLNEMTGGGASGTGDFGLFATGFPMDSDSRSIRFMGLENEGGTQIAKYAYSVPLATSHYEIDRPNERSVTTAYDGVLFVDTATAGLRAISIDARPTDETGTRRVEQETWYEARGDENGLIPTRSTLKLTLSEGSVAVNRTEYRGCRTFASQSKLMFADESEEAAKAGDASGVQKIPAGLQFRATMANTFDSSVAAAGDVFQARLLEPLKSAGETVAPKGSLLVGRVVRVDERLRPSPALFVRVKFSSIEFGGRSLPVSIRFLQQKGEFDPWPALAASAEGAGQAGIAVYGSTRLRLSGHSTLYCETE